MQAHTTGPTQGPVFLRPAGSAGRQHGRSRKGAKEPAQRSASRAARAVCACAPTSARMPPPSGDGECSSHSLLFRTAPMKQESAHHRPHPGAGFFCALPDPPGGSTGRFCAKFGVCTPCSSPSSSEAWRRPLPLTRFRRRKSPPSWPCAPVNPRSKPNKTARTRRSWTTYGRAFRTQKLRGSKA